MMLVAMNAPAPPKRVSLLTALTAIALAARIHGTDKAVMATGYRLLAGLDQSYMPVVLAIINSPSPLKHINQYVATMPPQILTMKVCTPALPMLSAG